MIVGRQEVRNSAVFAVLLLFLGCASQAPPSGGPPDRTPPRVVSTIPTNDSVAVSTDATIEVLFSEPVDRSSVERVVFLSPRPSIEPHFRWKGRRLRISLEGGLLPDRTYRVSIGAEGRDEYRNKMTRSHDFTFSTGETISRGEVSGKLEGSVGSNVYVVAYDLGDTPNPDPTTRAAFVTQAGENGIFRFPGLGKGKYRTFAFEDVDQDQMFDLGSEWLAIPSEDADLADDTTTMQLAWMRLINRDTVVAKPIIARTENNRRIRLKMSEAVYLPFDVSVTGPSGSLHVDVVHHDASDSSVVYLITDPQSEGDNYEVTISLLKDAAGNVSDRDTTLVVKGDGRVDTRSPSLVKVVPAAGGQVQARTPIVLTFDEAMSPDSVGALWADSDSVHAPAGTAAWLSANVWRFSPRDPWVAGDVLLRLNVELFRDLSDNRLAEPLEVSFKVVGLAGLGTVIGGVLPGHDPFLIEASGLNRDDISTVRVAPGDTTFILNELMPGKYILRAFIDLNDDGVWFPGAVQPFAFAEPLAGQIDTVEVRSRWETVVDTRFSRSRPDILPYKGGSKP